MGFNKHQNQPFTKSIPVSQPYEGIASLKSENTSFSRAQGDKPHTYKGITVTPNRWAILACEEANASVERGGGPFGAVLLQIDDETNEVIRYWRGHNHVTEYSDPTAHAEISAIRSACHELGVHNLSEIERHETPLHQKGDTSHCEIYSSCEPCPMCYAAIAWARIPVLVFSATRYEAAQPGVEFSDEEIHDELKRGYEERSIRIYQATSDNALQAFELWKKSDNLRY